MALVYAAILPHSPLFVPTIGQKNTLALHQTVSAMDQVAGEMAAARVDTVVCFTSHLVSTLAAIVVNIRAAYQGNYEEFGEFATRFTVSGNPSLATRLMNQFHTQRHLDPVAVTSQETLDYGTSIPVAYLLKRLPRLRLVPIGDTLPALARQLMVGRRLHDPLVGARRRIAVVASANLSHRLNDQSPAGFSPKAKAFDRRVLEAIRRGEPAAFTRFHRDTLTEVQECGLRPMLLLYGALGEQAYRAEVLSYEAPFGIGHLVTALRF